MDSFGKIIMLAGAALLLVGFLVFVLGRLGGGFLPGDIVIKRGNTTFAFPIVTSIVISIVLTVLVNLFLRR